MKCTFDKDQFTRLLTDPPDETRRMELEQHLAGCAECREEFAEVQKLWNLMADVPAIEPPASMRVNFQTMLNTYKGAVEEQRSIKENILAKIRQLFIPQPRFQLAYSFVLVIIGLGLGYLMNYQSTGYANKQQVATLSSQVEDMKQMMMLSLLENPSASERIRGVSYVEGKKSVDRQVTEALLTTLNNDPNVNVRLMTLEALTHLAGDPLVREGLVQSIIQQESPLVQSALADVMKKLQEKRAVQPFRKLLQQKDLNNSVRGKIEKTITGLI